jgi:ABC-type Fe3+/spermidine/putrescine transport system ATPase subunit
MTALGLRSLSVSYGGIPAVRRLSLDAAAGGMTALLGPSGCGKTTVLKTIAGLLRADEGEVLLDGASVNGLPPEKRGVGLVFQNPLLFPHLDVARNVGFGLKVRGMAGREAAKKVAEALERVRLAGFESRRPSELSGGQEQRVALARALVTEPRVLLLDEPFSALDENLREEMRLLVRRLQRDLRMTSIFVTHDQDEAVRMADRVALLLHGELAQAGPPADFYTRPHTPEVARFFKWQVFAGECRDGVLETAAGRYAVPPDLGARGRVTVAFRLENASVEAPPPECRPNAIPATVREVVALGSRVRYVAGTAGGAVLEVEQRSAGAGNAAYPPGAPVSICIPDSDIRYFGGG